MEKQDVDHLTQVSCILIDNYTNSTYTLLPNKNYTLTISYSPVTGGAYGR